MPRFVILEHDYPHLHWDLMLQSGDVLATWRLPRPPEIGAMPATRIGDHRPLYLDYEGPVSGNRGHVTRWDSGTYDEIEKTVQDWKIVLHGQRIVARAVLKRLKGDEWQLTLEEAK